MRMYYDKHKNDGHKHGRPPPKVEPKVPARRVKFDDVAIAQALRASEAVVRKCGRAWSALAVLTASWGRGMHA